MSFINDMLRDLAKQQPLHITEDNREQLIADAGFKRKPKYIWLPSLIIFLVVLMLLLLAQNYFFAQKPITEMAFDNPAVTSVITAQQYDTGGKDPVISGSVAENINKEAGAEAPLLQRESISAIDSGSAAVAIGEIQQAAIMSWLKLAGIALSRDRLTAPVEDNAWHYYRQVLAIAPQQPQALQGLADITGRYLQLVQEAMQKNEMERAQILLHRVKSIAPDHDAIAALETQLMDMQALSAVPEKSAGAMPVAQQPVQQGETDRLPIAAPAFPESYSLPASPGVSAAQLQVTPNRAWRDQQAALQARALMQQGQLDKARMQLEDFIQQQGPGIHSSQLLCQVYLDQGELVKATRLLQEAEQWPATERARMRAQIHIAEGNNIAAITVLEANLSAAENDERYRALLASLYHTVGDYYESAAGYRRLLNVFGEKSAYWLGLALSLDALEQKASALEAYRRAYEFQPQQAEVNNYIEQRLTALSR